MVVLCLCCACVLWLCVVGCVLLVVCCWLCVVVVVVVVGCCCCCRVVIVLLLVVLVVLVLLVVVLLGVLVVLVVEAPPGTARNLSLHDAAPPTTMRELQLRHLHGKLQSLNLAHLSYTTTGMASTTCTTGHRSLYRRQTGESLWSASVSRLGCRRPQKTQRFSQRAGTVGGRLSHPQPARENLHDRTTGTSATVSTSNWGISMVF